MKNLIMISLTFAFCLHTLAQDCEVFFPMKKDVKFEVTSFDKKDKKTGKVAHHIVDKSTTEVGNELSINAVIYDKKDKETAEVDYLVKCENDKLYIDMTTYMNQEQMQSVEGLELEMDNSFLEYPSNLNVGDQLADGVLVIDVKSGGVKMMTLSVMITNRKVEAKEEVTTPAGTFTCFRFSEDIESNMGIVKVRAHSITWYANNVGMVKSESYSKNGKYQGKSELTSIQGL